MRNCLDEVDASYDIVLIHDGARPFVEEALIRGSISLASKFGAPATLLLSGVSCIAGGLVFARKR